MDETQQTYKITSKFDPAYGGGYEICVEVSSTGKKKETWAYNKVDVDEAANRLIRAWNAEKTVETIYKDGAPPAPESPGEAEPG